MGGNKPSTASIAIRLDGPIDCWGGGGGHVKGRPQFLKDLFYIARSTFANQLVGTDASLDPRRHPQQALLSSWQNPGQGRRQTLKNAGGWIVPGRLPSESRRFVRDCRFWVRKADCSHRRVINVFQQLGCIRGAPSDQVCCHISRNGQGHALALDLLHAVRRVVQQGVVSRLCWSLFPAKSTSPCIEGAKLANVSYFNLPMNSPQWTRTAGCADWDAVRNQSHSEFH